MFAWGSAVTPEKIASFIDHTILRPDARSGDVLTHCREAMEHGFRTVCINSIHVKRVATALAGSRVGTCSVVGFPLGASLSDVKALEAERAVADGATEIDMVMAIGALKDGEHAYVRSDISEVKKACGPALLKVIIETCLLTNEEKRLACLLAGEAGADYVKTSTGFSSGGAMVADIALMRSVVGDRMGVKASGGIRTFADALRMIEAGSSRIGASSGVAIIRSA